MEMIDFLLEEMTGTLTNYMSCEAWQEQFMQYTAYFISEAAELFELSIEDFTSKVDDEDCFDIVQSMIYAGFLEQVIDGKNIVTDYIKRRGWKHARTSISFFEQWQNRLFSVYEIVDIVNEQTVKIRDFLFEGKIVNVTEKETLNLFTPGDFIIAKILEVDGQYFLDDCIIPTVKNIAKGLKKELKKEFKSNGIDIEQLKQYEILPNDLISKIKPIMNDYLVGLFIHSLIYLMSPAPKLFNSDNEEIRFTNITFKIKEKEKVLDALCNEKSFEKNENDGNWLWLEDSGRKLSVKNKRVLGYMAVEANKLICHVDSEGRAKRLIQIIKNIMSDFIGLHVIEYVDTFNQGNIGNVLNQSKNNEDEEFNEEERKIVKEYLHENLKESLDIKIPMLRNKTPRQCAKTNKNLVKAWIMMMEDSINEQLPNENYDATWAFEELGLKK